MSHEDRAIGALRNHVELALGTPPIAVDDLVRGIAVPRDGRILAAPTQCGAPGTGHLRCRVRAVAPR